MTKQIKYSIRKVNSEQTADNYVDEMYNEACNCPNGKYDMLTKIRTFLMTPAHGYRYTSLQCSTLLRLEAKLAAALKFNCAKPYALYEATGSTVWVRY
jgi:hypothetical protein